jgi:predicted aminopeptidase
MFNVSACRRDSFEPRQWTFPIVGTVPYLGYFDQSASEAAQQSLEAAGYDVFRYEVDAYSGAGYFPSVILSPMLERSDISLANTVFHELLHGTIWRPSAVSFNESLATFFGRRGVVSYFADRYPDRPDLIEEALETFEDSDRFADFMLTLFEALNAFYESDLSSEDKIAGREAVYQAGRDRFAAEVQPLMHHPERYDWVASLPANNAYMMGVRRYNLDLDVFEEVLAATGSDWHASVAVFRAAAAQSDPYAYLREWLRSRG